jgi:hypothetical protein
LRRLDLALHVLRDVHLFFTVLALAHQACQPLQHSHVKMVGKNHELNQCKKLKHLH